jgi:hypothetical protein
VTCFECELWQAQAGKSAGPEAVAFTAAGG